MKFFFGWKKTYGEKNVVKKNSNVKNFVTKNSTKHFFWWKEKNYGEKILLVKKIFLEKEFSLKKNSWKNLQVENILAKKKVLVKKKSCENIFW